jgi:hypothetical protein
MDAIQENSDVMNPSNTSAAAAAAAVAKTGNLTMYNNTSSATKGEYVPFA